MTNQALNQKMTGRSGLNGHGNTIIRILLVVGILALTVLTIINLRDENLSANTSAPTGDVNQSALPQDGRAYFTEPYWDAAKSSAPTRDVTQSALPQDGRAYFTEPYWEAAKATAVEQEPAEPEWSYYTEQYWTYEEQRK